MTYQNSTYCPNPCLACSPNAFFGDTQSAENEQKLRLDYYVFGMPMHSRTFTGNGYKFGFNGQEKEDDIYGEGNTYSAEYWMYDSRLGRRWNVDPVDQISISNYAVMGNNPIWRNDPKGDEWLNAKDKRKARRTTNRLVNKERRLNRKINRYEKRGKDISDLVGRKNQLQQSRQDIFDMTISSIVYTYVKNKENPQLDFISNPNIVQIKISNNGESLIHENRHGGDYARSHNSSWNQPLKSIDDYGYRDEISAWKAQLAWDGKIIYDPFVDLTKSSNLSYYRSYSIYPRQYIRHHRVTVTSFNDITKSMLESMIMKRSAPLTKESLLNQQYVYPMRHQGAKLKQQWDAN